MGECDNTRWQIGMCVFPEDINPPQRGLVWGSDNTPFTITVTITITITTVLLQAMLVIAMIKATENFCKLNFWNCVSFLSTYHIHIKNVKILTVSPCQQICSSLLLGCLSLRSFFFDAFSKSILSCKHDCHSCSRQVCYCEKENLAAVLIPHEF